MTTRSGIWRTSCGTKIVAGLLGLVLSGTASPAPGQPVALDDAAETANSTPSDKIGFSNGSVILAPVPFQNPVLGAGLAIGGAWLFQTVDQADTSTLGFGYFRTENGSEGMGLGFDLNFGLSGWQTSLVLGDIDLTYDLFVAGVPLPIRQTATGVRLNAARNVSDTVSVGLGLSYAESTVLGVDGTLLPEDLIPDKSFQLAKLSLSSVHDTRDDTDYPTDGLLASAELSVGYLESAARDRSYAKGVLSAAGYTPVFANGVVAWTTTGCSASDTAPFFDACSLGGTDNFRGYGSTEFIDRALLSAQVEFRGRIEGLLGNRLGYVAFAGVGGTGQGFGDAIDSGLKGAYGVGARFRLSRSFPVDYAIDISRNDAGEELLYVTVGQRF